MWHRRRGARGGLARRRTWRGAAEQRAVLAVPLRLELARRNETKRGRVDAVAQALRRRSVVEDVAEVRAGRTRSNFVTRHEKLVVGASRHPRRVDGLREARPAGPGFEFVGGAEEGLTADDIDVEPGLVVVPELVAKRRLGRLVLGDLVLERRQPASQL